ncbi:MAG: hypothetical protein RL160_2078 [Bacteroidota bacterium]
MLGTLDPLEGSVLIALAGLILSWEASHQKRKGVGWTLAAALAILAGVAYLFWISSLGGFGGNTGRSYWWALGILPYPVGWLLLMGWLLQAALKRKKRLKNAVHSENQALN